MGRGVHRLFGAPRRLTVPPSGDGNGVLTGLPAPGAGKNSPKSRETPRARANHPNAPSVEADPE